MRDSKELQIGKAGEYLVCADLILKGFTAYPSEQGLPYDVVLDIDGKLIKVQVKTTETYRSIPQRNTDTKAYIFNVKRKGKKGNKRYESDEVDLFALVCLNNKSIGYVKNTDMPDTLNLRVDELRGTYYDEQGIKQFDKCNELRKQGKSQQEISKILRICVSAVNRYFKEGYMPFMTKARYFSDIMREKEWFYGLK